MKRPIGEVILWPGRLTGRGNLKLQLVLAYRYAGVSVHWGMSSWPGLFVNITNRLSKICQRLPNGLPFSSDFDNPPREIMFDSP